MNSRVAAVALAASALFATSASADPLREVLEKAVDEAERGAGPDEHRRRGGDDDWRDRDDRDYRDGRRDDDGHYRRDDRRGPRLNRFGQTFREAEHLRRDAVNACSYEVDRVAWRGRFQYVGYDDRDAIHQYNRHGVTVRFENVEFRTRYGREDRVVTCVYDRGEVVRLDGVPRRGHGRGW